MFHLGWERRKLDWLLGYRAQYVFQSTSEILLYILERNFRSVITFNLKRTTRLNKFFKSGGIILSFWVSFNIIFLESCGSFSFTLQWNLINNFLRCVFCHDSPRTICNLWLHTSECFLFVLYRYNTKVFNYDQ